MRLANYVDEHQMDITKEIPKPDVIMRRSNARTNDREYRELIKRYKLLTPLQRDVLLDLDVAGQKKIAMLGIFKLYAFIKDFIIQVVSNILQSL
jgi:hypothetical protein